MNSLICFWEWKLLCFEMITLSYAVLVGIFLIVKQSHYKSWKIKMWHNYSKIYAYAQLQVIIMDLIALKNFFLVVCMCVIICMCAIICIYVNHMCIHSLA